MLGIDPLLLFIATNENELCRAFHDSCVSQLRSHQKLPYIRIANAPDERVGEEVMAIEQGIYCAQNQGVGQTGLDQINWYREGAQIASRYDRTQIEYNDRCKIG
jgi:hypothetical protein